MNATMPSESHAHPAPRIGIVTVSYGSDDVLPGLLATLPDAVGEPYALVIADNRPAAVTSPPSPPKPRAPLCRRFPRTPDTAAG